MIDSFTRQPHHYKPQETTECRLDRAVELIGLRGLHFIAFEFVEGENLRVLLERRRRIPVSDAPKAAPTMADSAIGVSITRSGPKW